MVCYGISGVVNCKLSFFFPPRLQRPGELASRLFTLGAGRIKKTSYTPTNEKHYKKGDCLVLLIAELSYRVYDDQSYFSRSWLVCFTAVAY